MDENNMTTNCIHLLGLQLPQKLAVWVFLIFLMIYCLIVFGNLLIITLVFYSKTLHSPSMYFFLSQFAILDILLATIIFPNLLYSLLVKEFLMPFSHCLIQFYCIGVSETCQCLLLSVMSYDRYLAISKPLHYVLVINRQFCWILVIACWALSIFVVLIFTLTLLKLEFSSLTMIDHFFCDFYPILEIFSTDNAILLITVKLLCITFFVTQFSVIVVSYIYITVTIFKMSSSYGRQKVFQTCSSHMTVVCIFYGILISIHVVPNIGHLHTLTKYLPLLYNVVTPLMNPIIYSLRNEDLKNAAITYISNFPKRWFLN